MQKREPSEKQLFKIKAKAFVDSIARKCFGLNYKNLTVTKQNRKDCVKYKLIIYKQEAFDHIKKFHDELIHRFTEFKVTYTGTINSKTGREEWRIEIIVFDDLFRGINDELKFTKPYTKEFGQDHTY